MFSIETMLSLIQILIFVIGGIAFILKLSYDLKALRADMATLQTQQKRMDNTLSGALSTYDSRLHLLEKEVHTLRTIVGTHARYFRVLFDKMKIYPPDNS